MHSFMMLIQQPPILGSFFSLFFFCRQWAIGYLSVLPTEWIQALPRFSKCTSKSNTLQEIAGGQTPSHNWTGKNTKELLAHVCLITQECHDRDFYFFFRIWNIWVKVSRGGQGTLWLCFLTHYCTPMLTLAMSSPPSYSGEGTSTNMSHIWSWGEQHLEAHGM